MDALAAEALGRHEESLQTLSRGMERAAVEEVREPFLVSGPQARPLLQERTHTKHIHRKLGTTSRRDAVQRGRALGIL